ncbi:hypothetical protein [Methylobrevis pamukkalensis]|uniref:Cyclophilin TM1367-like domain-containing protein n=1 Tax=Methylobrevis pamukkalensis TaxID=1439726 RepID=A0A1E3H6C7_9HYPH|nr:hypothetical protein [Methylobrevis pamukkalensis]ODN71061.1 hypothetical protein A6302_01622 [Methylobrevis pamukkalensis]
MRVRLKVDGEEACQFEVWEDKVPNIAALFREKLPVKSTLQHGKLIGDMVFFVTPFIAPWENMYLTQDVGRMRREATGHSAGAVCFYGPRQQLCVVYGDDTAEEPLKISYIGEIVEGHLKMKLVAPNAGCSRAPSSRWNWPDACAGRGMSRRPRPAARATGRPAGRPVCVFRRT